MTRYADPTLCPGCGARLPEAPTACPDCQLPLTGPVARTLYGTLQTADDLLVRLRATVPVSVPVPGPTPLPLFDERLPSYPSHPPDADPGPHAGRDRLSSASVPRILLGLGATCLIVAALTFLAVAWSSLGIGGRTAVLVVLTLVTGAVAAWFAHRGLRVAGESLTVVSFGFLALDLVGADAAGWLGDLSLPGFLVVAGAVIAVIGVLAALAGRSAPLVAPQPITLGGLLLVEGGALGLTSHDAAVLTVAVVALAAVVVGALVTRLTVLAATGCAAAALSWVGLVATGLDRAGAHLSVRELWLDGHAWPLAAAVAVMAAPALVRAAPIPARVGVAAVATALGTLTVVLPAFDDEGSQVAGAWLAALVAAAVAQILVPHAWRVVPLPTLLGTLLVPTLTGLYLTATAVDAVASVGDVWTVAPDVRIAAATVEPHPLFLVPVAAATLLALLALARLAGRSPLVLTRRYAVPLAVTLALAVVATAALYAVPLAVVVGGLGALAAVLLRWGLGRPGTGRSGTAHAALLGAGAIAGAALGASLASAWLTATVLSAVIVGAAAAWRRTGGSVAQEAAVAVLVSAVAALTWTAAELGEVATAHRAVPLLLVVGLAALARPRPGVEVPAAISGALAAGVAVVAADGFATSLAVHLTLAGALVTASSLLHASHRPLGWAGGLLLAAATWVRLADLGVVAPEAYTLPTATALVLVGAHRLWRVTGASTTTALAPGLSLATVPSLLWVLDDPVSLRAMLLGLGCLGLVFAGTRLRWGAPLVIGAVVGGLLVLREAAPYAASTPQWVMIGLAGTILTFVGVTWESRLNELRLTGSYLRRLR